MEVDGVGMGCCLIKTSVFKDFIKNKKCSAFNPITESVIYGEDFAFCLNAQRAGYKIYVDTEIQCKHQTVRYIDEAYFKEAHKRMKAAEALK
jgi:GT2 family glycosyltransferase